MRVVPDGGSGVPAAGAPQYPQVSVNVNDLADYAGAMMRVAMDATGPSFRVFATMPELVREAFDTVSDPVVGAFAEGAVITDVLTQYQSDFQHFFSDLTNGLLDIANAAEVIYQSYLNTDAESAASVNAVDFAFADPGATRPAGYAPTGPIQTMLDRQVAQQQTSGAWVQAAMGDTSQARVIQPVTGLTVYLFPDGSQKVVYQGPTASPAGSATVDQETILAPDGSTVSSTTTTTVTLAGGLTRTTTVDRRQGTPEVTTVVQANADGSQTITTTEGGTSTTTTVAPDAQRASGTAPGPVQQAEQRYHTDGTDMSGQPMMPGY